MSLTIKPIEALDIYREYRAKIEGEYEYFNRRLTWLMASQSFLIAAYVAVLFPNQDNYKLGPGLSGVVAFVGLFTCASVLAGLYAAYLAVQHLKANYDKLNEKYGKPLEDLGGVILNKDPTIWSIGRFADIALPNMFVVLWFAMLGLSLHTTQKFSYPSSKAAFAIGGSIGLVVCLIAAFIYRRKRDRISAKNTKIENSVCKSEGGGLVEVKDTKKAKTINPHTENLPEESQLLAQEEKHKRRWKSEDAKTVREMIVHEANFVNYRIGWMTTLQGLFFAALGFAWRDGRELIYVISILGIAAAFSTYMALRLGRLAQHGLVKDWDINKPEDYIGPDVIGIRSGEKFLEKYFRYFRPWYFLPVLFTLGWIAVIIINFQRRAITK